MQASPQFERETQFFGFNPVTFLDDVSGSVEDYTCDGLEVFETFLDETFALRSKSIVDKMSTKLAESIDKNLDQFEMYVLKNVLNIPDDCMLPTTAADASPDTETMARELSDLEQSVHTARARNQAAKLSLLRMQKELAWAKQHQPFGLLGDMNQMIPVTEQMKGIVTDMQQMEKYMMDISSHDSPVVPEKELPLATQQLESYLQTSK